MEKSGKYSRGVRRNLLIEIYKTLNNLDPSFIKEVIEAGLCSTSGREQFKLNLDIPRKKQVAFGTRGLGSLGSKIYNGMPYHRKSTKNLNVFKDLIKNGTVPRVVALFVPCRNDKYNIIL